MTENNGQWERELVAKLATAALKEQRRARLWGIFFKLLTFAYVTLHPADGGRLEGRATSPAARSTPRWSR